MGVNLVSTGRVEAERACRGYPWPRKKGINLNLIADNFALAA